MTSPSKPPFLVRHAVFLVSLVGILVLYGMALPHHPSADEQTALAKRFQFTRFDLPRPAGFFERETRPVHPSMMRISAWVSAMGAAATLGDADGDGLPNDLCHVEPRSDQIQVLPVPGTGQRYAPFLLTAAPLLDDESMAPMGCFIADLNEDGAMDFLVYFWGRTPIAFLRKADASAQVKPGRDAYLATEVVPTGWSAGTVTLQRWQIWTATGISTW